jgi:hypothetical protein
LRKCKDGSDSTKEMKTYASIIKYLGSFKDHENFTKYARAIFSSPGVYEKMDTRNKLVFAFNNGVYDLREGQPFGLSLTMSGSSFLPCHTLYFWLPIKFSIYNSVRRNFVLQVDASEVREGSVKMPFWPPNGLFHEIKIDGRELFSTEQASRRGSLSRDRTHVVAVE